jgi:hypothetical protein
MGTYTHTGLEKRTYDVVLHHTWPANNLLHIHITWQADFSTSLPELQISSTTTPILTGASRVFRQTHQENNAIR